MKEVDIANFADDNTPFTSANNTDDLIHSLEKASSSLFKWFKDNLFKSNPDKCHLLISTNVKTKTNTGKYSIKTVRNYGGLRLIINRRSIAMSLTCGKKPIGKLMH